MKRTIFFILFTIILTSCGKFEENQLLNYSDENKNYQVTTTAKKLNEKDSLIAKEQPFVRVYNLKNKLINVNNSSFYFYDKNDKLVEAKFVYKREGRSILAKIITDRYVYDKKGRLIKIVSGTEEEEMVIKTFKYNRLGKLESEISPFETINYEYLNNKISKKTILEDESVSKISEYKYDRFNRIIVENWVFSGTDQMITYYKYYPNNKLRTKRDSSYSNKTNPNEYVEFLTEYYYDKKDSIIERRNLGRILSEKTFKLRGKTKFEYKRE